MQPSAACCSSSSCSRGIEAGGLRAPPRAEDPHSAAAEEPVQHRHGDEDAVAIAGETLGFDDRQRVRRRRHVEISDVLVAQRLRHQKRRVSAERRFDVPARQVAAGNGRALRALRAHHRADNEKRADRHAAAFQEVTIFRQPRRRLAPREPREGAQPELPVAVVEAACEQRRDGGNVGFADLTAAQGRHGSGHSLDHNDGRELDCKCCANIPGLE